jgi:hypothetical protein
MNFRETLVRAEAAHQTPGRNSFGQLPSLLNAQEELLRGRYPWDVGGAMNQSSPAASRRVKSLFCLVALLSVLLVAVLANAFLHGGDDPDPVAAAAERTAAMGARLALDVKYHFEGEAIAGRGRGAYNARTGRSRAFLTLPIGGETTTTRSVGDESHVYLRGPTLDAALPPGKEWTEIEPMLGHFTVTAFSTNGSVQSTLEALKAVDDVESLGREAVRGRPTTRYEGTIQLSEKTPDEIRVEAWIDQRGLIRKVRIVERLPEAAEGSVLTMDLTTELFDFGAEPKVELPTRESVLAYTPVARAELQMLDGEANAGLIEARPAALSESEFRRRGLAICDQIRAEVKSVSDGAAAALRRIHPGVELSELSPVQDLATARLWSAHLTGPIAGIEKRILQPLAALGPPDDVASPYRELLQQFAIDAEAREAQARALQAGAFNIFTQVEDEFFTDNSAKQATLLREVGLGSCFEGEPDGEAA